MQIEMEIPTFIAALLRNSPAPKTEALLHMERQL